jgi:hypothetical protein
LLAATAAIAWSGFTITVLHLVSSHNPVTDTLSSYAFTDRGTGLLGASMLALAAGSLALLGALLTTRMPVSATTRVLFGTWSAGLATAAIFPASYAEHPNPISGEIHLYSCLVAFVSLPALGFSLLARLPELPGRALLARLTVVATGALVLFGIGFAFRSLVPVGVVQRVALIADLAVLCSIIGLVRKSVYLDGNNALLSEDGGGLTGVLGAPSGNPLLADGRGTPLRENREEIDDGGHRTTGTAHRT